MIMMMMMRIRMLRTMTMMTMIKISFHVCVLLKAHCWLQKSSELLCHLFMREHQYFLFWQSNCLYISKGANIIYSLISTNGNIQLGNNLFPHCLIVRAFSEVGNSEKLPDRAVGDQMGFVLESYFLCHKRRGKGGWKGRCMSSIMQRCSSQCVTVPKIWMKPNPNFFSDTKFFW